jgi:hypothetical protein
LWSIIVTSSRTTEEVDGGVPSGEAELEALDEEAFFEHPGLPGRADHRSQQLGLEAMEKNEAAETHGNL